MSQVPFALRKDWLDNLITRGRCWDSDCPKCGRFGTLFVFASGLGWLGYECSGCGLDLEVTLELVDDPDNPEGPMESGRILKARARDYRPG